MRDPRIIAQSSNPRFAQQNPWMVQIRTLRITYILVSIMYNTQVIKLLLLINCSLIFVNTEGTHLAIICHL